MTTGATTSVIVFRQASRGPPKKPVGVKECTSGHQDDNFHRGLDTSTIRSTKGTGPSGMVVVSHRIHGVKPSGSLMFYRYPSLIAVSCVHMSVALAFWRRPPHTFSAGLWSIYWAGIRRRHDRAPTEHVHRDMRSADPKNRAYPSGKQGRRSQNRQTLWFPQSHRSTVTATHRGHAHVCKYFIRRDQFVRDSSETGWSKQYCFFRGYMDGSWFGSSRQVEHQTTTAPRRCAQPIICIVTGGYDESSHSRTSFVFDNAKKGIGTSGPHLGPRREVGDNCTSLQGCLGIPGR